MPCQYAIPGQMLAANGGGVGASFKTSTTLVSIAGLRPRLFGWTLGAETAPNATDCSVVPALQLFTAAGTVTAVTPVPTDIGYQASKSSAGTNATVEPTYAGIFLWGIPLNQRASQQIWTPPNMPITIVGTAANGIGMQLKSSNFTGTYDSTFYFEE